MTITEKRSGNIVGREGALLFCPSVCLFFVQHLASCIFVCFSAWSEEQFDFSSPLQIGYYRLASSQTFCSVQK